MIRIILIIVLFLFVHTSSFGSSVKVISKYGLEDTVKRYESALKAAEVPLLKEKPFKKTLPGGFSNAGKALEFSNPFYGWTLGECHRGLRKDKPMMTRIYKDTRGQVWVEYTAPESRVNAFGVIECGNETDKVRRVLDGFADSATE
ncbi:MAG TPA: hypothetical protein ENK06_14510 [Gammaproteobacteria bacterium]|nr:hypothetical protein [Gammaproteobacteria bacterium]